MLPGRTYKPEDILSLLWKRKWMIVVPFVVCAFGALLVSRFMPNEYRSDTLIQVVPQRVPESYVQSTVTSRIEDRLNSISQQIMSRTRLERIIQEFSLYPAERKRDIMEDVVDAMRKDIKIDMVGGRNPTDPVDAFRVSFTYPEPRTTQRVTERLASLFVDENLRDRGSLAEATSDFLTTQLNDARAQLEAQDQKLKAFRERYSDRLPTQAQSNMQAIQSIQMQLQALSESLARDRDRKLMLERLYNDANADMQNAARYAQPSPVPGTTASGDVATQNEPAERQLARARATLAQLQLRLKPEHPDIVRMKRVIADLEKKAEQEALQRPVSNGQEAAQAPAATPEEAQRRAKVREMKAEIESLDRQVAFKEAEERRLRGQIGQYQARLEAVPGLESDWVSLTRDYDTQKRNYEDLLSKSESSKVAANLERRQIGEQFRVLDPARMPERPVSPNRLQINGVGAALGLALGLALIGLLEYKDSSLRTEDDVRGALALPVIALVPYTASRGEIRRQKRRRLLTVAASVLVFVVIGGGLTWYLKLWNYVA